MVGEVDADAEMLCTVAEQCRDGAIDICGPGVPLRRIGDAVR